MAELTRMQKYAQLRESLANDKEASVSTKDLSDFENRFNTVTEQLSNVHSRFQDDNTSSDVLMQNNQEVDTEKNAVEALAEDVTREDTGISNNEESTEFANQQLNGEPVVLDIERNEEPIIVEPDDLSETPEEIADDLLVADDNDNQEIIVEDVSEDNNLDNVQEETEDVIVDIDSAAETVEDVFEESITETDNEVNIPESATEDVSEEILEDNFVNNADENQDSSMQENEIIENNESVEIEEPNQEETIEDIFDNNETDFNNLSQESEPDNIDIVSEDIFEKNIEDNPDSLQENTVEDVIENNNDIKDNQEDVPVVNSDDLQENIVFEQSAESTENNPVSLQEDNESLSIENECDNPTEEISDNDVNNENKEIKEENTVYDEAEINDDDFKLPSFDDLYFGDVQWQEDTEESSEQVVAKDSPDENIENSENNLSEEATNIFEETTSTNSYTDMFTAGDYDNVIHDTYDSYFDNLQSNNPTTEIPVLEESGNMETYTSEMPTVSDDEALKQDTKDDNASSYLDEALNEADLYSRVNGENTVDKLAGNIIDEVRHNEAELDTDQDDFANDMTGFIETPVVNNNQTEINDSFKDTVTMEISKIMDEISANSFANNTVDKNEDNEYAVEDNEINSAVDNTIPYLSGEEQKDAIEIKNLSELQENEASDPLSETIPFIVSDKENKEVEVVDNGDGKNTVLNIILIVLIIILVAVLGLIVFYILKTQNII